MKKRLNFIIYIQLLTLALTGFGVGRVIRMGSYHNVTQTDTQQTPVRIVEVLGRASIPYGGLGHSNGYLVRDSNGSVQLINYKQGSRLSTMEQPQFLELMDRPDGTTNIAVIHTYDSE